MPRKLKVENTETPENTQPEGPQFIADYSTSRTSLQPPANSIVYEKDTGNRYRFLENGTWELIDNVHS